MSEWGGGTHCPLRIVGISRELLEANRDTMSRNRPDRLLAALLLVVGTTACLPPHVTRAGDLYDLDGERETLLATAGLLAGLASVRLVSGQPGLTTADVAALDADRLNALDRPATRLWSESAAKASDILELGMVAGPLLLVTQAGDDARSGEILAMYGETVLLNVATVGLLKTIVGRTRPYAYNDNPAISQALKESRGTARSFPSGHTTLAFGAAVFTGEVYARLNPDDPGRHWVRGGALALAVTTGWLRVRAGRHFPTDVLAGAALGSLVGWAVPRLHEVDHASGDRPASGPGLVLGFRF